MIYILILVLLVSLLSWFMGWMYFSRKPRRYNYLFALGIVYVVTMVEFTRMKSELFAEKDTAYYLLSIAGFAVFIGIAIFISHHSREK